MIAPSVIREIERLLQEDALSQRKIALLTGVSRSTVGMVASGRRSDYGAQQETEEAEAENASGPPERCRECGGLVYGRCRLCRVRAAMAIQRDPLRFRRYWRRDSDNTRRAG